MKEMVKRAMPKDFKVEDWIETLSQREVMDGCNMGQLNLHCVYEHLRDGDRSAVAIAALLYGASQTLQPRMPAEIGDHVPSIQAFHELATEQILEHAGVALSPFEQEMVRKTNTYMRMQVLRKQLAIEEKTPDIIKEDMLGAFKTLAEDMESKERGESR